jgi:hypothetical protein
VKWRGILCKRDGRDEVGLAGGWSYLNPLQIRKAEMWHNNMPRHLTSYQCASLYRALYLNGTNLREIRKLWKLRIVEFTGFLTSLQYSVTRIYKRLLTSLCGFQFHFCLVEHTNLGTTAPSLPWQKDFIFAQTFT